MPTQGPNYPATRASLANAGTSENAEAWVNVANVGADDGAIAAITAATYDSPDISQLIVASAFGFTIPDGSTIDGITVEVDRSNAAGAASDNRIQLAKGTTFASLVGTNKADTATDWPTALATVSYGGAADLWGTTWTVAEINASSFAVFLSVQADAANTDVGVDFIRVTITYTLPPGDNVPPGGAVAGGTAVVAQASLTIGGVDSAAGVAPTVQAGGHTIAGAEAQGVAIASARADVTPGGALAGGFAPTEPGGDSPTPGGAIAGGNAPGAVADSHAIGAATAGGPAPGSSAAHTIGGAVAGGVGPLTSSAPTIGGALAAGVPPSSARVSLTSGGAIAGGVGPDDGGPDVTTIGGAIAGGFDVGGARVPPELGAAIVAGIGPTGIVVPLVIGGALAGGFTILVAEGDYGDPDTGTIIGAGEGSLAQPITGRTV